MDETSETIYIIYCGAKQNVPCTVWTLIHYFGGSWWNKNLY